MAPAIRPARPGDVGDVRAVARASWHAAHAPLIGAETVEEFLAEFYDPASIEERIARDDAALLVASEDDDIVGFGLVGPDPDASTTHVLSQLYVHPERWGEGIGSRLLAGLETWVRDRGGSAIELNVMSGNDRAIAFYEAAGFAYEETEHDDRIDVDSHQYRKELS